MSDVLCIYYSRSGATRQAMEEIAQALGAETVELRDGVARGGVLGALRSGMDAMRKDCEPLKSFQTERRLEDYRLVIVGTPVWAGRCSAPVRTFLKSFGEKLERTAFVLTRKSEGNSEEVYRQMDGYLPQPHRFEVALRGGSVGYCFWQEDFLRQVKDGLAQER